MKILSAEDGSVVFQQELIRGKLVETHRYVIFTKDDVRYAVEVVGEQPGQVQRLDALTACQGVPLVTAAPDFTYAK